MRVTRTPVVLPASLEPPDTTTDPCTWDTSCARMLRVPVDIVAQSVCWLGLERDPLLQHCGEDFHLVHLLCDQDRGLPFIVLDVPLGAQVQ